MAAEGEKQRTERQARLAAGSIYATGKLVPLNGRALVYEWEVDGSGNAQLDLWEWK